ncbi:SAM-dependent methyltransferase [Rhizomonospora bruguierae]|uniref:SAM-dependent methyltransferase n=1 Tax=Rhizomonospora bruguierae TaxID=1581705 RepID=UPI001BCDE313|nr:class I SAM-dependent methyltransferase [Micromonospora sp. NBRC 107566]
MDLPQKFVIRALNLRIISPLDATKLTALGAAIAPPAGASIVDLCCGKGELLATWARDHGVTGTGVDISTAFLAAARARAADLGVADRVRFVHADASGYVADRPADIASCLGATWIGDGVAGTLALLERSLRPGGLALVGEPYWRAEPPHQRAVEACHAQSRDDFATLPDLVASFGALGWDLVEMMLADPDTWDRYTAAQWLAIRTWLDANPGHDLAGEMRSVLEREPLDYVRWCRDLLGWGVFALKKR